MNKFSYLTSIRFHALNVLSLVGIIATFSSADTIGVLLASKAIGIITLTSAVLLGVHWYNQGRMSWVDELLNFGEE